MVLSEDRFSRAPCGWCGVKCNTGNIQTMAKINHQAVIAKRSCTLDHVVEVTVVGAVVQQAVPERRSGWTLNSRQLKHVQETQEGLNHCCISPETTPILTAAQRTVCASGSPLCGSRETSMWRAWWSSRPPLGRRLRCDWPEWGMR